MSIDVLSEPDTKVLMALADWESQAAGHDHISVEQLAGRMHDEVGVARIARAVKRLVAGLYVDAIDVTSMGSAYPEYLINGLTARGLAAAQLSWATRSRTERVTAASDPLGIRRVDIKKNSRQVFVAYPFSIPADDYRSTFKRVGDRFGMTFVYADERISNTHILAKIASMIRESAFGVYDLTGWNPNVTLELGIAIGLSEEAFFLLNPSGHESADAPADLRGFDRMEYQSYSELATKLTQLLQSHGLRGRSE